jgi:hypothetical protein
MQRVGPKIDRYLSRKLHWDNRAPDSKPLYSPVVPLTLQYK